ncbi:MAG: hypothetical protein H0V39_05635 [Nitrosomonas sp.]|nr:hypothetical protein [Nitrosomonas sp.]
MPNLNSRKFAVLGILWPSKKFAEEDLIPSGAAGINSPVTVGFIQKQLDDLKGVFDKPDADATIEKAKQLVPQLESSKNAQREFANLVRSLPEKRENQSEDASDRFFTLDGADVMNRLSKPMFALSPHVRPVSGAFSIRSPIGGARGQSGVAAGLGNQFSGLNSAARNLINYTTYYQMKERAGIVGRDGVNLLIRKLNTQINGLRFHLIGHSFGARLVTSAVLGPNNQQPLEINSATLLQAAFSHNSFASKFDGRHDGFFRKVISEKRIIGPIVITCTQNDKAVGLAYPLASLISGQNASGIGDKNDPFGAIGRNGAQKTPEASDEKLLHIGGSYQFKPSKLHNLNSDEIIKSHSDICHDEIAYAILNAVATT